MCFEEFVVGKGPKPKDQNRSKNPKRKIQKKRRQRFSSNQPFLCPRCSDPLSYDTIVDNKCDYCGLALDGNYPVQVEQNEHFFVAHADATPIGVGESTSADEKEQNVGFSDDIVEKTLLLSVSPRDPVYDAGMQARSDLASFLSRPVDIYSTTWTIGTTLPPDAIYPWLLYFANDQVLDKVRNYKLLRATMKIKILVNGSPFHYGRVVVGVRPTQYTNNTGPSGDPNYSATIVNYLDNAGSPQTLEPNKILYLQRPHVFINPSKNIPAMIDWPFFKATDWIDLTTTDDFQRMGVLEIWELNPLRVANGQATADTSVVTISFFAWLEDVQLTGITPMFIAHAGRIDEFQGDGVVSAPASAVANLASRFANVPRIGKFAKATQIGANAVSGIASLFGYSNPNNVEKECINSRLQLGRMAHTDGSDPVVKLSLDPKNELTIDPSTVGLTDNDELAIMSIAQREGLICQCPWTTSDAVGSAIISFRVHPAIGPTWVDTQTWRGMTPLSFVSYPFMHWTGSLIYRFQLVASQFHRGRLAFVFSPDCGSTDAPAGDPLDLPANYVHIIDLTQETDVSFQVNWAQAYGYASVYSGITDTEMVHKTGSILADTNNATNGRIGIYVINGLTSPSITGTADTVTVNMYVRAGDDFQLQKPRPALCDQRIWNEDGYKAFPTQAGTISSAYGLVDQEDDPQQTKTIILNGEAPVMSPYKSLVYFGENIQSIRSLMKRYCYYIPIVSISTVGLSDILWPFFPLGPSLDTSGYGTSGSFLGTNFLPNATFVANIPLCYIRYFCQAYVGTRGGVKYKFASSIGDARALISINRQSSNVRGITENFTSTADTNSNLRWRGHAIDSKQISFLGGGQIFDMVSSNTAAIEAPFYSPVRYKEIHDDVTTTSTTGIYQQYDNGFSITVHPGANLTTNMSIYVESYVAAGEDFTFFFFIGCPAMIDVGSIP